jgi:hypothetical protein
VRNDLATATNRRQVVSLQFNMIPSISTLSASQCDYKAVTILSDRDHANQ